MKKKGAALAMVLIMTAAVLILGSAVSAAVVNSTKLNAKYNEYIDLELAAKSLSNLTIEFISSEIKGKTIDEVKNYISTINLDSTSVANFIKDFKDNKNINIDLVVSMDGDNKINVTSTANEIGKEDVKKVDKQIIELNVEDIVINKVDLNALVDVMVNNTLVLLQAENKDEYFNVDVTTKESSNIYIQPFTTDEIRNNKYSLGIKKIYAPKLKLNYGTYNTSNGKISNLSSDVLDNANRAIGKVINLSGYKFIIINGDLNFSSTDFDSLNNTIIYVTGKLKTSLSTSVKITMNNSCIISKGGIDIGDKVQLGLLTIPTNNLTEEQKNTLKEELKAEIRKYGVDIPQEDS